MADSGKQYKFVEENVDITKEMDEEISAMGKGDESATEEKRVMEEESE